MNTAPNQPFPLSDTHRMLLRMRDTLYEGSWEDFVRDLEARAEGKPHVFETLPASPNMVETIGHHLALIRDMQQWEACHGQPLSPDG